MDLVKNYLQSSILLSVVYHGCSFLKTKSKLCGVFVLLYCYADSLCTCREYRFALCLRKYHHRVPICQIKWSVILRWEGKGRGKKKHQRPHKNTDLCNANWSDRIRQEMRKSTWHWWIYLILIIFKFKSNVRFPAASDTMYLEIDLFGFFLDLLKTRIFDYRVKWTVLKRHNKIELRKKELYTGFEF